MHFCSFIETVPGTADRFNEFNFILANSFYILDSYRSSSRLENRAKTHRPSVSVLYRCSLVCNLQANEN